MSKRKRFLTRSNMKGLTLFETLLVLIILSIIISFSFYFFNLVSQSELVFEETLNNLKNYVETAREKARLGEGGVSWEVVFVNSSTKHYVELKIYSSSTVVSRFDLPNFVVFLDPSPNTSKSVVFGSYSGTTTSSRVLLKNTRTNSQKYLCIPTSSPSFFSTSSLCSSF